MTKEDSQLCHFLIAPHAPFAVPGPNTGGEEQGGEYYINGNAPTVDVWNTLCMAYVQCHSLIRTGMFPLTCQIDAPELRGACSVVVI